MSKYHIQNLRFKLFCALIILLAFAVRVYQLDRQSIWFDEGWSAYAAVQPDLLAAWNADATNPPLYYVLINISTRFFGDSAFSLRFFSLLMGLLALPVGYRLTRDLFNRRAGLYALLLFAISPLLWWAAQEARMYTLLALLVLLCAWAWQRLLDQPRRGTWALLLVSELLLLYAHNTGPVVVLWLNTATLIVWIVRRSLNAPAWKSWIAGQVLVGLCWLPYFVSRFLTLQEANNAVVSRPQLSLDFASRIWQAFWTGPWTMVGHEPLITVFAIVALGLFLALMPWRKSQARWLLLHVVLLVGGLIVGLSILGNELHGRYLVMVAPLLLVPLAAGIARLPKISGYLTAGVFVVGLIANIYLAQNPQYQHDDTRAMVQYYADTLAADDTVLAWSYAERYDLRYYWDRLRVTAPLVTLPEGADRDTITPLLPESGQVALNVWYTQRADFRGMMNCLLSSGTRQLPQEHQVYGMSNLTYEASALNSPQMQASAIAIVENGREIALIDQTGQPAVSSPDQALCLPISLTMQQTLAVDLKASVSVRNVLGWEVARTDAIFATANQRTTSALDVGESATAYILLRLPYGAPPENYDLSLTIYDEESSGLAGYDLRRDSEVSRTINLGAWPADETPQWDSVHRPSDLPFQVDYALSPQLRLVAHNVQPNTTIRTGDTLRLALLWEGTGPLPDLELAGVDWTLTIPPGNNVQLDWREVHILLDTPAGNARLQLPDGFVLGQYEIEALPVLLEEPDFDTPVDESIPGITRLSGYSVDTEPVDHNLPLDVTLIWQAESSEIGVDYVVFVQLLDADGQLIAQSDSMPAQGQRPTTGWREGEYILDTHQLTFNAQAASGKATLIIGLYDPLTGARVPVDSVDYLDLPGEIEVQ